MLTTITAGLLIGASTGLLFNVRMVLHLSIVAVAICGATAVFGQISPGGAALYAIVAVIALQAGYFVSLMIAALGLTREPARLEEPLRNDANSQSLLAAQAKRSRAE